MVRVPAQLETAFRLFVSEFDEHLDFLRHTLRDQAAQNYQQQRQAIAHRLHTIKGGAGFLGLSVVAQMASAGEAVFKVAADDSRSAQIVAAELPRLLAELERARLTMNDLEFF